MCGREIASMKRIRFRPQSRWEYPLNLSILLSGGKETNQDSPSSGERTGKSPAPNPAAVLRVVAGKCGVREDPSSRGRTVRPSPS